MHRFLNALAFQIGWLICIASVRYSLEIPALLICAISVGLYLFYSDTPVKELKLSLVCLGLGVAIDSSLQYFSVISFYGWALGPLSPFWLWMVWVMFALTLNSSLSFLQRKPLFLSALAGLLFGPLSYVAGAKLGAAALDKTWEPIASIAGIWMLTLPMLVFISKTPLSLIEVNHDAP
jgi:hypothetical protein